MKQKPHDPVQSPAYYTDGRYETVEAIEAWGLDHHAGDALAYISRAGKNHPTRIVLTCKKRFGTLTVFLPSLACAILTRRILPKING